jgi:hypothetical protein
VVVLVWATILWFLGDGTTWMMVMLSEANMETDLQELKKIQPTYAQCHGLKTGYTFLLSRCENTDSSVVYIASDDYERLAYNVNLIRP